MRYVLLIVLLGLAGNCVSQAKPADDSLFIERIKKIQEEKNTAAKEQFEKRCDEQAIAIYAKLMQEKDLHESHLLEELGVRDDEPLTDSAYTHIIWNRMYEDNEQLPRRTALMREVRMRLNETERGRRLLMLMSKEKAVRQAIQHGSKEEALILNSELKKDYDDFEHWVRNTQTSTDTYPFSTILSTGAVLRDAILHSENGETQVKKVGLVEVVDNPYREGKIGMLLCSYLPSTNSPIFANTIGKQIQDSMSLAEIYSLLERELGKGATPYIFAIKYQANCVGRNDETEMRQYVQMRTYSDGTYADPEAAYLLAKYLWGNNRDNPYGIATEYERWKEGYMMMMKLAFQDDERAIMFLFNYQSIVAAIRDVYGVTCSNKD